jgi:hypothetical protein
VASRAQIARLEQRIDELVARSAPSGPPTLGEHWFVEGDKAWMQENPQHVITWAELEARPNVGIVSRFVHADNGRPAACCSAGGACYAIHGPVSNA